jgi:hypothetical protein
MPPRPPLKTGKQVAVLLPFTPLRCGVIEWEVLPDGTATRPLVCQAPATVHRVGSTHTDLTLPPQEDDMVCAHHWRVLHRCQICGAQKGSWQDALCAACQAQEARDA